MLEALGARGPEGHSRSGVLQSGAHRHGLFSERTVVTFRPVDLVGLRRYLNQGNPLDKAGAYAIQEQGDLIVESISGSNTNVMGLPFERLGAELAKFETTCIVSRSTPASTPATHTPGSTDPRQQNPPPTHH